MNLGASCWLISLTRLLKPFRRATQAGDWETEEISALSSRSGGQWSARKVCRQKTSLAFMGESTLPFKHLNFLSGVVQNNTERSIFVTDKLNLLKCYMEEFVITNIKYKHKAYLLTKRTKLCLCNVNEKICFVSSFHTSLWRPKMEKKISAYITSNGHYWLCERQWWTELCAPRWVFI